MKKEIITHKKKNVDTKFYKKEMKRNNINSAGNNNYCTFDSSCSINCNIDRERWNIR